MDPTGRKKIEEMTIDPWESKEVNVTKEAVKRVDSPRGKIFQHICGSLSNALKNIKAKSRHVFHLIFFHVPSTKQCLVSSHHSSAQMAAICLGFPTLTGHRPGALETKKNSLGVSKNHGSFKTL